MLRALSTVFAALGMLFAPSVACAFSATQSKGPATLSVSSGNEGNHIGLSDSLHLTLMVEAAKGLEVEIAPNLLEKRLWSVVRRGVVTMKALETGRVRWQQSFVLAPLAPGPQTFDVLPLRYREPEGDWQTAVWDSIPINVTTQILEVDSKNLRDITAIEELPSFDASPVSAWLWLLPIAALIFAAGVLYRVTRRARLARYAHPAEAALRMCARLGTRPLQIRAQRRRFTILLTGVVRRYLERTLKLPARRLTTEELTQQLEKTAAVTDENRRLLHAFFVEAALGRYAPDGADVATCQNWLDALRQYFRRELDGR